MRFFSHCDIRCLEWSFGFVSFMEHAHSCATWAVFCFNFIEKRRKWRCKSIKRITCLDGHTYTHTYHIIALYFRQVEAQKIAMFNWTISNVICNSGDVCALRHRPKTLLSCRICKDTTTLKTRNCRHVLLRLTKQVNWMNGWMKTLSQSIIAVVWLAFMPCLGIRKFNFGASLSSELLELSLMNKRSAIQWFFYIPMNESEKVRDGKKGMKTHARPP